MPFVNFSGKVSNWLILATEYVTQMKKLITEERTRLEQLKESMYAIC